jgi:hypothetical protein
MTVPASSTWTFMEKSFISTGWWFKAGIQVQLAALKNQNLRHFLFATNLEMVFIKTINPTVQFAENNTVVMSSFRRHDFCVPSGE